MTVNDWTEGCQVAVAMTRTVLKRSSQICKSALLSFAFRASPVDLRRIGDIFFKGASGEAGRVIRAIEAKI